MGMAWYACKLPFSYLSLVGISTSEAEAVMEFNMQVLPAWLRKKLKQLTSEGLRINIGEALRQS